MSHEWIAVLFSFFALSISLAQWYFSIRESSKFIPVAKYTDGNLIDCDIYCINGNRAILIEEFWLFTGIPRMNVHSFEKITNMREIVKARDVKHFKNVTGGNIQGLIRDRNIKKMYIVVKIAGSTVAKYCKLDINIELKDVDVTMDI